LTKTKFLLTRGVLKTFQSSKFYLITKILEKQVIDVVKLYRPKMK